MNRRPWRAAAALVLFGLALFLYIRTLAPSVATLFDDSLEFQLVAYLPGIAHPTGYPLYTLLGWLFTRLPIGDVAFRVNLMSAVFGALSVALVFLAGLALAGPRPGRWQWLGAVVGAGCLALSPVFWSQTALAEVYTLNSAFVALILYLLANLVVDRPVDERGVYRRLLWVALAFGLGLAHHRTVVLLLPAALLAAVTALHRLSRARTSAPPPQPQFGWKQHLTAWLLLGLAMLLPLFLYLYLPLRGHVGSLDGSYQNTLSGFVRHVTASGYGGFLFDNPFGVDRGAGFYLDLFLAQFGWLGIAFGLLGLAGLARRRVAGFSLLAFFTCFAFNLAYLVADIQVFFIPCFLIGAVWIGAGLSFLLQTLADRVTKRWVTGLVGAGLILALAVQMGIIVSRYYPGLDRSSDWAVHDYGLDVMQQPLEPGAAIVGIQGEITLFRYFQATQGLRPDLTLMAADREPQRWAVVEDLLARGRAVYLTRDLPGAAQAWALDAAGPLIRVRSQTADAAPQVDIPVDALVAPGMRLHAYEISRPPGHAQPARLRLTLVWQADGRPGGDWKMSARLLAADDRVVAQADAAPVHFAYPTSAWRPGEFVTDVYDFSLPPELPPGMVTPVLIVYDPAQGAAELGRISLAPVFLP